MPGEAHWVIEQRCALVAKIQAETPITVIGLHLSTTVDQRQRQLEQVSELVESVSTPIVLMGDFNSGFPELQATHLSGLLENVMAPTPVFTCPNGVAARKCIDHIWVSKDWRTKAAWVVSERQGKSDHNPIVADLSL
jgi:endonuclease/exonuclease/phosphatase family metal-dependent hydrolase